MDAASARVGSLEDDLQAVLDKSPELASRPKVVEAVGKVIDDIKMNPNVVNETDDVNATIARFMNHPALKPYGDQIPLSVMNRMKQAFYKSVGDKKYTPGYQLTMEDKTNKALAHGMRAEVAEKAPQTVPTLAEQSELLNVLKVAGPNAERRAYNMAVGLGSLSPRLINAAVWMLDRYPWFKSYLARQAYHNPRLPQEIATAGVITQAGARQQQE